MSQIKVKAYLCIDEHGNYRIVGSSDITDMNKNTAVALVEDEIKREGVNSVTTTFQVNIELPTPTPYEEVIAPAPSPQGQEGGS